MNANNLKYFGTDGVRGEYGRAPITVDFIQRLAWAAGRVLAAGTHSTLLVGHDGRRSHTPLLQAVCDGLTAAGVKVESAGLCPTPAIAHLVKAVDAMAGVVVSASHNPAKDNGIKFFTRGGGKLSQATQAAIEAQIPEAPATFLHGTSTLLPDAQSRYAEFCKASVNHADLSGWHVVVDGANGAMSALAPAVLRQLGARVEEYCCAPTGDNINANCGATALLGLQQQVQQVKADVGIAFDGDGDRVMMVSAKGSVIHGDIILYLIATATPGFTGGVVGTVMSNMGLEQVLNERGIAFTRTQVGDAQVLAACHAKGWRLGGEPSGHVICLNQTTTGDGLIAALQVLSLMSNTEHLEQALACYTPYPQTLVNVNVSDAAITMKHPALLAAIKATEDRLAEKGRLLIRPSGTEPLIRVLVEGQDSTLNRDCAEQLVDTIRGL